MAVIVNNGFVVEGFRLQTKSGGSERTRTGDSSDNSVLGHSNSTQGQSRGGEIAWGAKAATAACGDEWR